MIEQSATKMAMPEVHNQKRQITGVFTLEIPVQRRFIPELREKLILTDSCHDVASDTVPESAAQ